MGGRGCLWVDGTVEAVDVNHSGGCGYVKNNKPVSAAWL